MARPDRVLLGFGVALLVLHLLLPLVPGLVPALPAPNAAPPAPTFGSRVADIASWWWLLLGAGIVLGSAIQRQPDLLMPRKPSFSREALLTAVAPVLTIRQRARMVQGIGLIGLGAALFFVNQHLLGSLALLVVLWLWAAVVPAVALGVLLWLRRSPAARFTEGRRLEMPAAAWPKLHLALRHAAEEAGFRVKEEAIPDPRKRGVPPWTSPVAGVKAQRPSSAPPYYSTGGMAAGFAGIGFLVHGLLMGALGVPVPGHVWPLALVLLFASLGLLLYAGVRHQRGELLILEEATLPQGAPASIHVTLGARGTPKFDEAALKQGFDAVAKVLREFGPG